MCGFAGYFEDDISSFDSRAIPLLEKMSEAISHRGPDGKRHWFDGSRGLAFTHARLAIIDVSDQGAQPMTSESGRYVLVLNGEIYNHVEMRKALEIEHKSGLTWRGHSDTESLLMCFEWWGIEKTLQFAVGMYAFAIFDYHTNDLILARDRFGEKPLYYGWQGEGYRSAFVFSSEISALRQHPSFENQIDRKSLSQFLRYKCVSGQSSIYTGIKKLEPGTLLRLSLNKRTTEIIRWWNSEEQFYNAKKKALNIEFGEAVQRLENLLLDATRSQMQADVPLGAFLSGGIDSSLIVALMQKQKLSKIKTFSIGFTDSTYNEAIYAQKVADYLDTDHSEFYVTPNDALNIIPELPKIYSEPFADSSQIPTFLVSRLAREKVTVALSGDAGDELFCGYNRYKFTNNLWGQLSKIPHPMRLLIYKSVQAFNPVFLNKLGDLLGKNLLGDKILKGSLFLTSKSLEQVYEKLISDWDEDIVIGAAQIDVQTKFVDVSTVDVSLIEKMMLKDTLGYLVDDILVKVDRAAMANGLETRVPFLDPDVVKFAWELPLDHKLRNGVTKAPLREILYKYVPRELVDRPKMGFGVPIDQWLRGPLRDWAEDLLDVERLQKETFFDVNQVRLIWEQHLSGKRNWQGKLWNILMFQAWYETQRSS